jgi:hypothetical protein
MAASLCPLSRPQPTIRTMGGGRQRPAAYQDDRIRQTEEYKSKICSGWVSASKGHGLTAQAPYPMTLVLW